MERLTEYESIAGHAHAIPLVSDMDVIMMRLAACEDTALTPESVEALKLSIMGKAITEITEFNGVPIARLRELADADKDGRVVALPCKVGDTVWAILDGAQYARKCVVEYATIGRCFTVVVFHTADRTREQYGVPAAAFGKTVFLTREEAKEVLEAMKDG